MRKFILITGFCALIFTSCKKEKTGTSANTVHNMSVGAFGSPVDATYNIKTSYVAKGGKDTTILESKLVNGSVTGYSFFTDLHTGDLLIVELQSTMGASVNYVVQDGKRYVTDQRAELKTPDTRVSFKYVIVDYN